MGNTVITRALALALLGACSEGGASASCPDGTTRSGDNCIEGSPQGSDRDSGSNAGPNTPGPDADGDAASPVDMDASSRTPSLPLYVDDWYAPSGYMGDIAGIKSAVCAAAGPSGVLAYCHRFDWTPSSEGWAGVFWQYPERNWGTLPGLAIPAGATRISFWAWGETGGEKLSLGAGYEKTDGFSVTSGELTLTTTPTEYTLELAAARYDEVAGAFSWSAGGSASTFYLDGIRWEKAPDPSSDDGGAELDAGASDAGQGTRDAGADGSVSTAPTLPLIVDDWFVAGGYMGDGEDKRVADDALCGDQRPSAARGKCHHVTWTPPAAGGKGFAGVYWQSSMDNWGQAPGVLVPKGAAEVRFVAWGKVGGEKVKFVAGSTDIDGFEVTTGDVALASTPTEYVLRLDYTRYSDVVMGFGWFAGGSTTPVEFYLDDIRWLAGPTAPEPTPPAALPVAVDDFFSTSGAMGDAANGGVLDEPICATERPGGARGRCHRITWTPKGAGWAGVYSQYPANNWGGLPGLLMPAGATRVRFYAWGESGEEKIKFAAGIEKADGFARDTGDLTLTTTPTEYTLELASASYSDVVGGFAWFAGGASAPVVFFLDDIRWE